MPTIVDSVDSTNRVLARMVAGPEGTCIVADEQTAGRGRMDRSWVSTAGAGLWMSVRVSLVGVPPERWPLLTMAAALAARDALAEACGVAVGIKWPNDLVTDESLRKIGGLLTEVIDSAAIVGIGINVAWPEDSLPTPESTSVLAEGGVPDRAELLAHLLVDLEARFEDWRLRPSVVAQDYRLACLSIGRDVLVRLPDGSTVKGRASEVDDLGGLVVSSGERSVLISAGDVIHATISPWDTPRNS